MSAEDLGKRLLREVEEVGLDEILQDLRLKDSSSRPLFGFPPLDTLLQSTVEASTLLAKPQPPAPIIELMSLSAADGKTHLLYHLSVLAILPANLGGRHAAIIVIDTDNRFSASRLAQMLQSHLRKAGQDSENLQEALMELLKHVHIFRPQSLPSTTATIQSLRSYLFNANKHHSFDRPIGFIALDSASAFYWQTKSATEDAALLPGSKLTPQLNGYVQLAAALKNAIRIFNAPLVYTTWHLGSSKNTANFGPDALSFRLSLPPPWQTLATLRLVVRRAPIRKLPVEISVEEAVRESEIRQKVVEQGKFQCFINEWGIDERTLQKLRNGGTGFDFHITGEGVKYQDAAEAVTL